MKTTMIALLLAVFSLNVNANEICKQAYLDAISGKTYLGDMKELYNYNEYRKFTETDLGATLSYPIMVAAATIAGITIVPAASIDRYYTEKYYYKMSELLSEQDSEVALEFTDHLLDEVNKKVCVDQDTFVKELAKLKSTFFFCPPKDGLVLTEKGKQFLKDLDVDNMYELYARYDRNTTDAFWNNLSHFKSKFYNTVLSGKETVSKLINHFKSIKK